MTCGHEDREPVLLLTGEHVADVCASCLAPLPPDGPGSSPPPCDEHDTVPEQEGATVRLLCRRCGWRSDGIGG